MDLTFPTRINKFLAQAGVCSRREADRLIQAKKVTINGKVAGLGDQVQAADKIKVSGKEITRSDRKIYIAFHKPYGVISTSDPNADNTILDWIDVKERIFPVGRLDVQSSGLILLTNDGEIVNGISKAEHGHEKEYLVTVDKPVTPAFVKKMAEGVFILGRNTMPAKVKKIAPNEFTIVLIQGMNKQIRRMCEALGYEVINLKRTRVMNIYLDDLPRGKWRYLEEKEQKDLLKSMYKDQANPKPKERRPQSKSRRPL